MPKGIIAFDFDGVICDGLAEYFYSAWLAYKEVWQPDITTLPEQIRQDFYTCRPVIETGWEMVVLIQALLSNVSTEAILRNWQGILEKTLQDAGVTRQDCMIALDQVRDRQIQNSLDHWLSLHHFYGGMAENLKDLLAHPDIDVYIITTKEARFTHQLLTQRGIDFPETHIFGKEVKRPKTETLKRLLKPNIEYFWFIEDRLPTLRKVRQDPALGRVQLFLAVWGYNLIGVDQSLADKGMMAIALEDWRQRVTNLMLE